MKKIIFFILIILSSDIYSQTEVHAIVIPQGFTLQQLNSKGTSNLLNNVSNLTSMNPAAVNYFQKPSFDISYQFELKSETAWIAGIGSKRINTVVPQSAGVVLPVDGIRFALGMSQIYNAAMDLGNIKLTTPENPDGLIISINPEFETTVYNYSFLISYSFMNFLALENEFSIAFKYSLNQLHYYENNPVWTTDVSVYSSGFGLGAAVKLKLDMYKNLLLGLSFNSETSFRENFKPEDKSTRLFPPDSIIFIPLIPDFVLVGRVPASLEFDIALDLNENLQLLGNISNVFWNDEDLDNLKDQIEFSGSAVFCINDELSASAGFHYTDRNYKQDFSDINEKFNAFFLITGLEINFNNFSLDLAAADSHLFSGEFRNQTIGKIAVGFHL